MKYQLHPQWSRRAPAAARALAPLGTLALLLAAACRDSPPPQAMQDKYFKSGDGTVIHYIEAGRGSPVILIHGLTSSAERNWVQPGIFGALAARHRVIAPDLRGHGKSDKPHDPAKYGPRLALDIIDLMNHLKIPKAHIHGYSLGGTVVQLLLARFPERFITAAFGGSGVREDDPGRAAAVPADTEGTDPAGEAEFKARVGARIDYDPKAIEALLGRQPIPGEWIPVDLARINFPVLAINGEYDRPNEKTHRLARELKDFTNVVLPGRTHLTALLERERYIEALSTFIDAHNPKDGAP